LNEDEELEAVVEKACSIFRRDKVEKGPCHAFACFVQKELEDKDPVERKECKKKITDILLD